MTYARRMWLELALVAGAMALGGCHWLLGDELSPEFCKAHPTDEECRKTFPDADTGCASNAQCAAPTAVCALPERTCVQCTAADHDVCTGATPACGTDDKCRACAAHAECSSNACLPDGSCGTDTTVAYVDPAGTGTTCTQLAPCKAVADALKTGRAFVKFQGVTNEQVSLNNTNVTFLADPGAALTDTTNGILLKIDGTSQVAIYDLTIRDASGMNNPGISLQPGNTANVSLIRATVSGNIGGGISATGGTLTISQSTVSGNPGGGISATGGTLTISQSTISGNVPGGGISVSNSAFIIVGNVLFSNGHNDSFVGGLSINTKTNAMNRLEFNTIVANNAEDGTGSGIHCLAGTFTAKDNIIADNTNLTTTTQIDGGCTHTYTLFRPGMAPMGTGNIGGDPLFVNEAKGDLHLQATSQARGKADPAADLTGLAAHDIDGDTRIAPADLGAYQVKP